MLIGELPSVVEITGILIYLGVLTSKSRNGTLKGLFCEFFFLFVLFWRFSFFFLKICLEQWEMWIKRADVCLRVEPATR